MAHKGAWNILLVILQITAIGNERLISCDEQQVAFKWRDSSDNNNIKVMKLDAHEFIRRYLMHILPHRFMRARYFGILANAVKVKNTSLIKTLLSVNESHETSNPGTILEQDSVSRIEIIEKVSGSESVADLMERMLGIDQRFPLIKKTA